MAEMPEQVERPKVEALTLRALLGTWEGEATFCGALPAIAYETSDEHDWSLTVQEWKDCAPAGTEDFREVWIDLPVDLAIFATPKLNAEVLPDA